MASMSILIKELREKTGAGMLDCKNALCETNNDIEKAIDHLRKKGILKAEKKSTRVTSQGLVFAAVSAEKKEAAVLEYNSETDFVAKNEEFKALGQELVELALKNNFNNIEEFLNWEINGLKVEEKIKNFVAKIGENMSLRRFCKLKSSNGFVSEYIHLGGKIGVIVSFEGEMTEENLKKGKDVAMHIAAMSPKFVNDSQVTQSVLDREKDIYREEMKNSNKPENIIEKIVEGKLKKYYEENCLENQKFVKNPDFTVKKYLNDLKIIEFKRYLLGDGIEKKVVDFAQEVREQIG